MTGDIPVAWLVVGIAAQSMFFLRFFLQWICSEAEGRSVVPVAFWYFSLAGAAGLLCYGVHRQDPVILLGQSFGFLVYIRNLTLIGSRKRAPREPTR